MSSQEFNDNPPAYQPVPGTDIHARVANSLGFQAVPLQDLLQHPDQVLAHAKRLSLGLLYVDGVYGTVAMIASKSFCEQWDVGLDAAEEVRVTADPLDVDVVMRNLGSDQPLRLDGGNADMYLVASDGADLREGWDELVDALPPGGPNGDMSREEQIENDRKVAAFVNMVESVARSQRVRQHLPGFLEWMQERTEEIRAALDDCTAALAGSVDLNTIKQVTNAAADLPTRPVSSRPSTGIPDGYSTALSATELVLPGLVEILEKHAQEHPEIEFFAQTVCNSVAAVQSTQHEAALLN